MASTRRTRTHWTVLLLAAAFAAAAAPSNAERERPPGAEARDEPLLLVDASGLVRLRALQGGATERELLAPGAVAVASDPATGRIVAAFGDGTLAESLDGGLGFVAQGPPLPAGEAALALAVSGRRLIVAAAAGGVLVLDETGITPTWEPRTQGLPQSVGAGRAAPIVGLVAVAGTEPTVVGATDRAEVVRSVDGGLTWQVVTAGPANPWRAGRAVLAAGEGAAAGTLVLARPVVVNSEVLRHVLLRSDDVGATWSVATVLDGPVTWLRLLADLSVEAGTEDGPIILAVPALRTRTGVAR